MKIGLLNPAGFAPSLGGFYYYLKVAEELKKIGADVTLYTLTPPDKSKEYNFEVSTLTRKYYYKRNNPIFFLLDGFDVLVKMWQILPSNLDILYVVDVVSVPIAFLYKFFKNRKVKLFTSFYHIDRVSVSSILHGKTKIIQLVALFSLYTFIKSFDAVFAISDFWKERLIKEFHYSPEHLYTAYSGIELDNFNKKTKTEARKILNLPNEAFVLYTNNIIYEKGTDIFVDSLEKIPIQLRQNLLILTTGRSDSRILNEIENTCKKINLKFRYDGRVPDNLLSDYYSSCDIFFLLSRVEEGWGISVAEAMASRRPIICSNRGALPELVGDGGIIVPLDDKDLIASKFSELLSNSELRDNLARLGFMRIKNFSWKNCAQRYFDVSKTFLNKQRSDKIK
jgi:glycosyltransferase involved in cell wall biosynthesis